MEPAVVDRQAAILGLGEHINKTVVPQHLVREIGSAGVDRLRHRLVETSDGHNDFNRFRRERRCGRIR